MISTQIKVICEQDGCQWTLEPQEDCDNGVILTYEEPLRPERKQVIYLGSTQDVAELVVALTRYLNIKNII